MGHPSVLLFVLCLATFMASVDLFIVNVGLPEIGRDLHAGGLADLSWILNAYAIVFATVLVPAGRLADRIGVRTGFLIGLVVFGLGSLGCALSGGLWTIVALRMVQAVGAALLVPTSLGLLLTATPLERRASSVQIWAVAGSFGGASGPALGGLLVDLSWRLVFLVNVPVAAAALILGAWVAPSTRHALEARFPDLIGGLLLVVSVGSLTTALVEGSRWGWTSWAILLCVALFAVGLALFIVRSARAAAPVVDLALFRNRRFSFVNVANVLIGVTFGMNLLATVLWLEEAWGWDALRAGLAIAPGPLMVSASAFGLRRWTRRLPSGVVAAAGCLLLGGGGVIMAVGIRLGGGYWLGMLPGWMLAGAGVGLYQPTLIGAGTASLRAHEASTGSAVIQMGRQIGMSLGVAVLVALLGAGAAGARSLPLFTLSWAVALGFSLLAALAALALLRPRTASAA